MTVNPIAPLPPLQPDAGPTAATGSAVFGQLVNDLLASHAHASDKANAAVEALATGQSDDLHGVSLAVAQADLSFRFLLEMRNRLTEAYQEVMRMPV